MERGSRRNVERQIRRIIRKSGDNCTICGAEFQHNTRTVGGVTADGTVALAGECCADKVAQIVTSGLFVNRNHQDFMTRTGRTTRTGADSSPEAMEETFDALQAEFVGRDRMALNIQRRAGIHPNNMQLNLSESPWKADDAAWFAAHPNRSHRLRPLIANEGATIPPVYFASLPPEHEVQIVVRQTEPGKRIRAPFGRNLAIQIPDNEEIIHAIFDMIFKTDSKEGVIGIRDVAELANKFAALKADDVASN
jgi:hypothetical protein